MKIKTENTVLGLVSLFQLPLKYKEHKNINGKHCFRFGFISSVTIKI